MTTTPTSEQLKIIARLCRAYDIPVAKRALFEAEVIKVLKQRSHQGGDLGQQVVRAFSDVILTGGRLSTFEAGTP
jgi:hypothetical protein